MLLAVQALWLLAQATDTGTIPWPAIGVGSGPTAISAVMFYFYRMREREFAAERAEEKARYAALALDFREIVEKNTAVITRLLEQDQPPRRRSAHGD